MGRIQAQIELVDDLPKRLGRHFLAGLQLQPGLVDQQTGGQACTAFARIVQDLQGGAALGRRHRRAYQRLTGLGAQLALQFIGQRGLGFPDRQTLRLEAAPMRQVSPRAATHHQHRGTQQQPLRVNCRVQ